MAKAQTSKGDPAHARMPNTRKQESRAAGWRRGEQRKEARVRGQAAREAANRFAARVSPADVAEITRRHASGESWGKIAKDYKTDELAVARVAVYGKATPWQAARARRKARRAGS